VHARGDRQRPLTSARAERDFFSQLASQRGYDAESSRCFRLCCARDRGTRERGDLPPVHAPFHGRSAHCDATVAGSQVPKTYVNKSTKQTSRNTSHQTAGIRPGGGCHCAGRIRAGDRRPLAERVSFGKKKNAYQRRERRRLPYPRGRAKWRRNRTTLSLMPWRARERGLSPQPTPLQGEDGRIRACFSDKFGHSNA
jgi:hypothetical protein